MKHRVVLLCLVSVALLLPLGCDKADPVAPTGSTITLSASPAQVPSARGTSTITAVVRRANGTPVNPGTQVTFSTTLGTIDPVAETNSSGVAVAILHGDGRPGTAKVTATTGNVASPPTLDVTLGFAAGSVTLQASPANVAETGGKVSLVALVRDASGQPLPGASVNFSAPAGTLTSRGNFLETDSSGRATDTLTLSAADIGALTGDNFEVRVEVAGSTGQLMNDTFSVGILRAPVAAFSFQINGRRVTFKDESSPRPTSWKWDFGDGTTSTSQNPSHAYSAPGSYTVELTVRNAIGESSISDVVVISDN